MRIVYGSRCRDARENLYESDRAALALPLLNHKSVSLDQEHRDGR